MLAARDRTGCVRVGALQDASALLNTSARPFRFNPAAASMLVARMRAAAACSRTPYQLDTR